MYRISIVTVTYNRVDVIEETLRSVSEQDYGNLEYVVIDGASKDGTPLKLLINLEIRLIPLSQSQITASLMQ